MTPDVSEFVEPVYDLLRSNAGMDESGTLVTHLHLQPALIETLGLSQSQAHRVRRWAVKELEAQGRIRRDHPNTSKVWILQ